MNLRSIIIHLAAALVLGFPLISDATPMNLPLERGSCEDRSGGRIDLVLALQSDQSAMDAKNKDEGWMTRLVLEAASQESEGESIALWIFEDYIEKPVPFPPPILKGKLLCGEYGAGKDLYALLFVWRVSPYVDWQETWFYELRLPFNGLSGDKAVATWEEYIPALPLTKGHHIRDVEMLWKRNTAVILLGGGVAPGSNVSPVIEADLPSETLTFYPGNLASRLGVGRSQEPRVEPPGESRPPRAEWFKCSSLQDCSVIRDECEKLAGVRQDSRLEYSLWLTDIEPRCERRLSRDWRCEPRLACADRRCSIHWFSSEPEVECKEESPP